jgi:hypothetical protein
MKTHWKAGAILTFGLGAVTLVPSAAHAQAAGTGAGNMGQNTPITLTLRDAQVRDALQQLFTIARVDYTLDPNIQGIVNATVTDQPFLNVLRIILRSANPPLTYRVENGVYIVQPRQANQDAVVAAPPPIDDTTAAPRANVPEKIYLTYIGPEIAQALGGSVLYISSSQSQQGGGLGGGGFGGGFGGMGGGGGLGGGGLGGGGFGGGLGGGGGGFGGGGLGGGGGFGGGGLGGGGGFGGGGGGFGGGGGGFGGGGGGFGR